MPHIINLQQNKSHNDSPVASASSQPPAVIASLERSEKRSNPLVWLPLALNGLRRRSAPRNDQSGWLRRFFQSKRNILAGFIVAIIVIILSFVLFRNSEQVKAEWFNDSWHYRMQFDVFNASTTEALVDFQVKIPTSTLTLSTLYTNSKVKSNFSDLRFTDINGNLLDYWFPDATSTMNAVYVKFPNLPKNATSTMFMYYGNNSADDNRNGPNVFPDFFEDFSDGNYTTGKHAWSVQSGAFSILGNSKYLQCTNGSRRVMGAPSTKAYGVWDFDLYNGNTSYANVYYIADRLGGYTASNGYGSWIYTNGMYLALNINYVGSNADLVRTTSGYLNMNQWYHLTIKRKTNGQFTFYKNGALVDNLGAGTNPYTHNTYTSSAYYVLDLNNNDRIDNLVYRKFAETDPRVVTTAGASEEIGGGPVGYWKFDEGYGTTAFDSSSYKNNGTLTNMSTTGTSTVWTIGKVGEALMFDGTNDYVSISTPVGLKSAQGSISYWVKTNKNNIEQSHFHVIEASTTDYIRSYINASNVIDLYIEDDNVVKVAVTYDLDNFPGGYLDKWLHIIWLQDGTSVKLYINGRQVNLSGTNSGSWWTSHLTLSSSRIGGTPTWGAYTNAIMDEFKIYNYALTASQILTEYNQGKSVILSQTPEQVQNSQEGLVGHWKMDESITAWDGAGDQVNDYSGNGNNGTAVGTAHATTTAKYGNSGEFDGDSDYVNCGSGSSLSMSQQFTLEVWVNQRSSTGYQTILNHGGQNASGEYWLYLSNGKISLEVSNGVLHPYDEALSSAIGTGWHHVAVSFEQGKVKAYLDGSLTKQTTFTISDLTATARSLIFGTYASPAYYLNGLLDDVKIYNIARTPDQIMQDYLQGPSPIAYYDFEEGQGTTLSDKSGQGNNSSSFGGGLGASSDWVKGKYGRALDFDGNDYVDVGNTAISNITSAMTAEAWVKFDYLDYVGSTGSLLGIGGKGYPDATAPNAGWWFSYDNRSNGKSFTYTCFGNSAGGYAGGNNNFNGINYTFTTGKFYHIAFTVTPTEGKLYIDGVQQGLTKTFSNLNLTDASRPLRIGALSNAGIYFKGKIDEIKLFNYALTPWQIAQEYNQGKPTAQWSFDEGSGTSAYNTFATSSNALIGTLYNMSTTGTSTAWQVGKVDKALNFDGLNDMVTVPNQSFLKYTGADMSWSVWVKPSSAETDNGYIISKPWNGSGQYNYRLLFGSNRTLQVYLSGATAGTLTTTEKLPLNQWSHLVFTIEGTSKIMKIYINGELSKQGTHSITSWTPGSGDNSIRLALGTLYPYGTWAGDSTFSFKGLIDEINYYTYVLSPAQIKKDYNDSKAVVMGTSDSGQQAQQGLVGFWKMDEATTTWDGAGDRVNDYSGNNNAGTSYGHAHATSTARYGNSGEFDGTDDYVSITDADGLEPDKITMEAWVYPLSWSHTPNAVAIITKRSVASNGYFFFYLISSSSINIDWGGNGYRWDTGYNPTLNTWTHLVYTYDGTNGRFFVNGSLYKTTNIGLSTNVPSTSNLRIGADSSADQYWFKGLIDDVKIFNTARTPDQIMQDYLEGPDPIAYYDFNEGSGTTLYDKSGFLNANGTLTNGPTYVPGKYGKSLKFISSQDQYVNISDSNTLDFGTNNYSVSFWIKNQLISTSRYLLSKAAGGGGGGWGFLWNGSGILNDFYPSGGSRVYNNVTITVNDNKWHQIVGTADRQGLLKLYIDGVLKDSDSISSQSAFNLGTAYPLRIASYGAGSTANDYDGLIDEVKIYNYELTPWQIAQEYNGGGPIAHWKMDEGQGGSVYDWSGNNYTGTLSLNGSPATSTAWQTSTNCKINGCFDFDGTDDYVNLGTGLDNNNEISLTAWINTDTVAAGTKQILCNCNSAGNDQDYCLEINRTAGKISVIWGDTLIASSNQSVATGSFYHLAITRSGSTSNWTVKIYINGLLDKAVTTATNPDATNAGTSIGRAGEYNGQYFNGKIDDARIYNYALSPAQIYEVYNMGFGTYFK